MNIPQSTLINQAFTSTLRRANLPQDEYPLIHAVFLSLPRFEQNEQRLRMLAQLCFEAKIPERTAQSLLKLWAKGYGTRSSIPGKIAAEVYSANRQITNKTTTTPNGPSANALKVYHVLKANTRGKKVSDLSTRDIERITQLSLPIISRSLKELVEKGYIRKDKGDRANKSVYWLLKDA